MMDNNERRDIVNDNLTLIQKTDGLTFGTDALLLAAFIQKKAKKAAEFGAGSGIISMLILTRGKASFVDAFEVQEEYALLISRNAKENELENSLTAKNLDIRDYFGGEVYDAVFTNPPYMKTDSGKRNELDKKNIARHEVCGDITDFTEAAKRALKYGGAFYAVYRPDRLADLIFSMRTSSIEPKRLTFVHADTDSEAAMVLIEGKRGSKPGMILTPPLFIYKDTSHKEYTSDMVYITDNGNFPSKFIR